MCTPQFKVIQEIFTIWGGAQLALGGRDRGNVLRHYLLVKYVESFLNHLQVVGGDDCSFCLQLESESRWELECGGGRRQDGGAQCWREQRGPRARIACGRRLTGETVQAPTDKYTLLDRTGEKQQREYWVSGSKHCPKTFVHKVRSLQYIQGQCPQSKPLHQKPVYRVTTRE